MDECCWGEHEDFVVTSLCPACTTVRTSTIVWCGQEVTRTCCGQPLDWTTQDAGVPA